MPQGFSLPSRFSIIPKPDYDRYLEINRALFFITQCVAKNMVAGKRGGSIVNIGSMWARQAVQATPSSASAYSMAKAGLHALTQHLALELATAGIRVNAVSPAVVNTPIFEGFLPKEQVPRFFRVSTLSTHSAASGGPKMSRKSSPRYCPANPPGSRARFGMSMEALWRDAINTFRDANANRRSLKFMVFEARNNVIRLASKIPRLLSVRITILTFISILMTPLAMLADCQVGFESPSHLDAGFQSLYDLNFDAAQFQFSDWKARYPDDPLGPAAAASGYLFREFDRLGVLQSELFRDDQTFQQRKKLRPDPSLKALFDSELTLSEMLAAKQLAKDPASVNALLAVTMVNGLRADYAALIERKDGASLSYIKNG